MYKLEDDNLLLFLAIPCPTPAYINNTVFTTLPYVFNDQMNYTTTVGYCFAGGTTFMTATCIVNETANCTAEWSTIDTSITGI